MQIIYQLLFTLFAVFYLPFFILKGKLRQGLGERFGRLPEALEEQLRGQKVLWVHAVSVGEVALALRFANNWRLEFPETRILLTTTTVAGYEVAQKTKEPQDVLAYFPVDFRWAVRAFIRRVNPRALVILETEIWPNLLWEMALQKRPVFIMNGRISDKAFPKYRRVRFFLKSVLSCVSGIGAQDETMRSRFIAIGADPAKVTVTGNVKYDWQPPAGESSDVTQAKSRIRSGPGDAGVFLFLAASTHEGEEEMLMDTALELAPEYPQLRILLAPRHLNRLDSIEACARQKGLTLKKVFGEGKNDYDGMVPKSLWLLDRMGVLAHFYQVADAVFVGGSLVPVGGHNPVEPAFFSKPVLFGPHTQNFAEMSFMFCQKEAAIRVKDRAALKEKIIHLIRQPAEKIRLGASARQVVLECGGALKKNSDAFLLLQKEWIRP